MSQTQKMIILIDYLFIFLIFLICIQCPPVILILKYQIARSFRLLYILNSYSRVKAETGFNSIEMGKRAKDFLKIERQQLVIFEGGRRGGGGVGYEFNSVHRNFISSLSKNDERIENNKERNATW